MHLDVEIRRASMLAVALALVTGGCGLVLDLDRRDGDAGADRPETGSRDGGGGDGLVGKPCDASAQCEDGLACNGVSTCVAGRCEAGPARACDDGIACTADSCDEDLGCVHAPRNELCGADAFGCTIERCDPASGCTVDRSTADCDDGILCTIDVCDPDAGTADGCTHAPDSSRCGGEATCTVGTGCVGSECTRDADCEPLRGPCHASVTCNTSRGTCVYVDAADGTSCTDDDPCAVAGSASCLGGECRGMLTTVCPGAPCVMCVAGGAGCDGSSVRTGPCVDGDPCTTDTTCQADGTCGGAVPTMCTSSGPCVSSACDGSGRCVESPLADGTPCPAGTCRSGACMSASGCRSDEARCADGSCCPTACGHCLAGGGCVYCNPDEFNCVSGGNICVSRSFPATSCPGDPTPSACGCMCNPDIGETCCEARLSCCPAGDSTCCP